MGWGDCGQDSKGRPIGYLYSATCDAKGCDAKIHRGLAHACGGHHGERDWCCEGYFCETHRGQGLPVDGRPAQVCDTCYVTAKDYAIRAPADAEDLVRFFRDWEGEDWADDPILDADER